MKNKHFPPAPREAPLPPARPVNPWIDLKEIEVFKRLGFEIAVHDCAGDRVDNVRAFRCTRFGVHVKILGTVNGGNATVLGEKHAVVEFEAFIAGGFVCLTRRAE